MPAAERGPGLTTQLIVGHRDQGELISVGALQRPFEVGCGTVGDGARVCHGVHMAAVAMAAQHDVGQLAVRGVVDQDVGGVHGAGPARGGRSWRTRARRGR